MMQAWWFVLVMLLSALGSAAAAADSTPDAGLDELRAQALQLRQRALALEDDLKSPAGKLATVYVGVSRANFKLLSVKLTIDGAGELAHEFGGDETQSLDADGLYRLAGLDQNDGPHHLHATVSFQAAGEAAAAPAPSIDVDTGYVKPPGPVDLLVLLDRTWLGSVVLRVAPTPESAGGDAPRRYARFLSRLGQYLDAAAELERLRPAHAASPRFQAELAAALADYGLLQPASAAMREAQAHQAGPEVMLPLRQHLARGWYERGSWAEAEAALGEAPPIRAHDLLAGWVDLKSLILLAQHRYGETETVLRHAEYRADLASYLRFYNLGAALVKMGNLDQGLTALNRVGLAVSPDPAVRMFIDRANLELGSYFLRLGQGRTAIPLLARVHTEGPYSSQALLGLGWAWLAPAGARQWTVKPGDDLALGPPLEPPSDVVWDYEHRPDQRLGAFPLAAAEPSRETRVRRALLYWMQAAERGNDDPAAQEAQLAIAAQLENAGDASAAAKAYARAVDTAQAALQDLAQVRQYLIDGTPASDLFAAPDTLRFERGLGQLPPPPSAYYLEAALASAAFQEQFAGFRDLGAMAYDLHAANDRLRVLEADHCASPLPVCADLASEHETAAALQARIAAAQAMVRDGLRQLLLDDLVAQVRRRTKLLTDARFELARVYDRPPVP